MLSDPQIERYSRQVILPEVGARGQERLLAGRVEIIDLGGALPLLLLYLAAAGIGRVTAWTVEDQPSNDLAVDAHSLNPDSDVRVRRFDSIALNEAIAAATVVVLSGGSHESGAGFVTASLLAHRPLVWGFSRAGTGCVTVFDPSVEAGCYGCIAPSTTDRSPDSVLGDVDTAVVATVQATETIKSVLGLRSSLIGKLLRVDTGGAAFEIQPVTRAEGCPICRPRVPQ